MVWPCEGVTLVNPGAIASGNAFHRQLVQTVAILTLAENGKMKVDHINLANPSTHYNPNIDVEAGFAAAAKHYSELIVDPEIEKRIQRARGLGLDNIDSVKECFLRLSHECWSGRKDKISVDDVIAAFENDPEITAKDKHRCVALLT